MTTPTGPERFEPLPGQPHPSNAEATQERPVAERAEHQWPVPESAGGAYAGSEAPAPSSTAPASNPVRWSGKKTAVAAALAIGLTSAGAIAAAAALPSGQGSVGDRGGFGPGGQGGQFGPGLQNGTGQRGQLPGRFGRHRDRDGDGQGGQGADPNQQGGTGVDPSQQGGTGFDPSQIPGQTT
jgi:hypothetical protein